MVKLSKKIQVTFSDTQVEKLLLLRGEFGDTDSEIIRTIVISWLIERRLIDPSRTTSIPERKSQR